MIVTEEEAKTKRCQEGYAASPGATRNPATDHVTQSFAVPSMVSVGGWRGNDGALGRAGHSTNHVSRLGLHGVAVVRIQADGRDHGQR